MNGCMDWVRGLVGVLVGNVTRERGGVGGASATGNGLFLFFTMDSYTPFIVIAYLVIAGCTHTHAPKVDPEQMGVWEGLPFVVLGVSILYRVSLQSNSLLGCV